MAAEQVSSPLDEAFPDEERVEDNGTNSVNGDVDEDEDDVQTGSRRQKAGDGAGAQEADEEADDLFGDDDASELGDLDKPAQRQLDDAELDSGDDMDRTDRATGQEDVPAAFEEQMIATMDMEIPRQPLPEPSDGELYLLKVPAFLAIEPEAWQTTTFQPPTADHHSKAASATFSAYNTALSTIRWRHSPSDPSELQSNARINRWSDGSITLQLASDPGTQYEIDGNSLAPPQRNPNKPTPTSIPAGQKPTKKQEQTKDAYTYLVVPVESAETLRVTHKITAGLTVKQTESVNDDAIERLQAALSQAANATKVGGASGQLEATETDPELQRKQAEQAEKLQMRDRKKREGAQERERLRADRTLGRAGLSSSRYGGLNVGMLEDDEMEGRGRSQGNKGRAKPRRRRNSEYSEDEDFGNKRFSKEDSYDQEDDFVAPSDEEEVVEDDDDEDDGIVESQREGTPKRDRPRPAENTGSGNDEDAEGEIDDDVPQARPKRRRIVDDEDEDE